MKIVALDAYTLNPDGENPWDAIAALGELKIYDRTADADFFGRAKDADIILTNKVVLNAERIAALPNLKYISVLATGYNVVDVASAAARGIPVSNVPEYGTDSVVQHIFAIILNHLNAVSENAASVKAGDWSQSKDFCYWKKSVRLLSDLSLGIVGFGAIGQATARTANALGVKNILYFSRSGKQSDFALAANIEKIFGSCDIISLNCALGKENAKFVDASLLSTMKNGALLINTARGGLIDEEALAEVLGSGKINAALDVLSSEPPSPDNSLISVPNCTITPHMAWSAISARRRLMSVTAENISAFLAGKPQNRVD